MKELCWWFWVLSMLLAIGSNGLASQAVKPDFQKNRAEFELIRKTSIDPLLLKGEIIGINQREIVLNPLIGNEGAYHLQLVPDTKIFCNGVISQWEALRPVAPKAFFEGEALVNERGEVIVVNAFYYGEECVIEKFGYERGRQYLHLFSLTSEENIKLAITPGARLPTGESWKRDGQVVFILYNDQQEIRAVFLPD
ncbi:MAG: hypothetical protein GX075_01355 [Firmicutes bacterium]|nr:hypothetical protein [Bacillota bacterium]